MLTPHCDCLSFSSVKYNREILSFGSNLDVLRYDVTKGIENSPIGHTKLLIDISIYQYLFSEDESNCFWINDLVRLLHLKHKVIWK